MQPVSHEHTIHAERSYVASLLIASPSSQRTELGFIRPEYFCDSDLRRIVENMEGEIRDNGECRPERLRYLMAGTLPAGLLPDLLKEEAGHPSTWRTSILDQYFQRSIGNMVRESESEKYGLDRLQFFRNRIEELFGHLPRPEKNLREELEKHLRGEGSNVIPTHFPKLDSRMWGGFHAGNYVVVGGQPGSGKSSFLLQLLLNLASHRTPCAIYTFEQSPEEIHMRAISNLSKVVFGDILSRTLTSRSEKLVRDAMGHFDSLPLRIIDGNRMTLSHIEAAIQTGKESVVAVDYLQRLPLDQKRNRYEGITEASSRLNSAAKRSGKVLLVASSLNRNSGPDDTPNLGMFRESGQIEFDADIAAILTRSYTLVSQLGGVPEQGDVRLDLLKVRNGIPGSTLLHFDAPCFSFSQPDIPTSPFTAQPGDPATQDPIDEIFPENMCHS